MLIFPQGALAHAVLEKATPAPDSHFQSAPKEIVLVFNERLEKELFSIKLFNHLGEEVSKSEAKISVDQKQLKKHLTKLANGNYTISYSVISTDGHPIKGSYLFSVGDVASGKNEIAVHQQDSIIEQESMLSSVVRGFYYISLLLVAGWVLWGSVMRKELVETEGLRSHFRKWTFYLQCSFLLTNLGMDVILVTGLLDQSDLPQLAALLTGTTVGKTWVISMILSILGFVFLLRYPWLDRGWVILLLTAKSINGHAMAFGFLAITVLTDLVHLLSAAIWAGGLLFILFYYKKNQKHVWPFLVKFSKVALLSMVVLLLTGTALTMIYLPDLQYLLLTQWGVFLITKVIVFLFVIIVGGIIRFSIKKNTTRHIRKLVKADFILMLVILFIVAIFTQLSPLPDNKPLLWHVNEDNIEFTATISPKVPGSNTFMVEANTHEEGLTIKRIELFFINNDNPEVAPIQVPFAKYQQDRNAHYMIEGPYLPFAGNWTAEIRILDSEDNEQVFKKNFIVY
jgi:copper transport protein